MKPQKLERSDWSEKVNQLAAVGQPFLLLTDFEGTQAQIWAIDGTEAGQVQFTFPGGSNSVTPKPGAPPHLAYRSIPFATYRRAFRTVQRGLQRGDSFLTNLTFPIPVTLQGTLTQVYHAATAKYRLLLPERFVCFSPETFVTISAAGAIRTSPMKGTALDTPRERARLLADAKEVAEHATVVDLLRNDLSQVARHVRVERYRYLLAIETARGGLVQTSSDIRGQLPNDWTATLGDTLARLLPAGSVSGAPKPATLALIRRAEEQPRGYYCGVAGYFDGRRFDSCVLIRYLEQREGQQYFRSGGGITARSRVWPEYQELHAKVRIPGIQALLRGA